MCWWGEEVNTEINKIVFELFSSSRREGKRQMEENKTHKTKQNKKTKHKGRSKFDVKYM